MSLPKRDGVHDRYYLIHKPDTSPEVLAAPPVKITPPTRLWCEIITEHPFSRISCWSGISPGYR